MDFDGDLNKDMQIPLQIRRYLTAIVLFTLVAPALAQNPTASIDFVPTRDGFRFKNYRNEAKRWTNDLLPDDLVRMFGPKTSCKSFAGGKCATLSPAAEQWRQEILESMDTGHCEGIAVACERMRQSMPFKGKASANSFQSAARDAWSLQRDETLENYIAYYWTTQTFDEVKALTAKTAAAGPLSIARTIFGALKAKNDTYVIRFAKYDPKTNRISEPHAVFPFAVEERPDRFVISLYDNNWPGQTRFMTVSKNATERWEYSSKENATAKPDYIGDKSTKTLEITATSWREGRCFASKWRTGVEKSGCSTTIAQNTAMSFINAAFRPFDEVDTGETAEFFLTDEGDMLITDPNGDRIGFDAGENYFFDEIDGAISSSLIGGFFEDVPHYTLPFIESDEFAYSVQFSGKYIDEESDLDFVYAAPYFTVGFSGIRLDPAETLRADVSTDGEQITFTASADGETPEVFFAFDADENDPNSYFAFIEGVELVAGKSLTFDFDFEQGKLLLSDDDGDRDAYDIRIVRVKPDGTLQVFEQDDLSFGKADRYEVDFRDWDGKGEMCFKDDGDGDGFSDEECVEEPNEDDGN